MPESDSDASAVATAVTVSHDGGRTVTDAVMQPSYRRYLQRSKSGRVRVGDTWSEFINCGCGQTQDITLRVEAIEDGETIGESTTITVHARDER